MAAHACSPSTQEAEAEGLRSEALPKNKTTTLFPTLPTKSYPVHGIVSGNLKKWITIQGYSLWTGIGTMAAATPNSGPNWLKTRLAERSVNLPR
jgi:hypothetical protein